MKKILQCRRSSLALIGMLLLTLVAIVKGIDTGWAIAACSGAVAGANALQASMEAKNKKEEPNVPPVEGEQ